VANVHIRGASQCPYCDFNSHKLKVGGARRFVHRCADPRFDAELRRWRPQDRHGVLGGGTPSLFQPEDFSFLLGSLRHADRVRRWTAEVTWRHSGHRTRGHSRDIGKAGIKWVVVGGAQSFAPRAARGFGAHSFGGRHASRGGELRAAKLDNFNLDVMYALPQQTPEEALEDVRIRVCFLGLRIFPTISSPLEPGRCSMAPAAAADEDAAWQIQARVQKMLADAGYAQYEVSAYAPTAQRCRTQPPTIGCSADYVGIGAGAHGKLSLALPIAILRTTKPKQAARISGAGAAGGVGR